MFSLNPFHHPIVGVLKRERLASVPPAHHFADRHRQSGAPA
jgi:hypothetical protein